MRGVATYYRLEDPAEASCTYELFYKTGGIWKPVIIKDWMIDSDADTLWTATAAHRLDIQFNIDEHAYNKIKKRYDRIGISVVCETAKTRFPGYEEFPLNAEKKGIKVSVEIPPESLGQSLAASVKLIAAQPAIFGLDLWQAEEVRFSASGSLSMFPCTYCSFNDHRKWIDLSLPSPRECTTDDLNSPFLGQVQLLIDPGKQAWLDVKNGLSLGDETARRLARSAIFGAVSARISEWLSSVDKELCSHVFSGGTFEEESLGSFLNNLMVNMLNLQCGDEVTLAMQAASCIEE